MTRQVLVQSPTDKTITFTINKLDREGSRWLREAYFRGKSGYEVVADAMRSDNAMVPCKYPTSIEVSKIIAQLDVLRETLPAITSSDLFPQKTQRAVERAGEMLAEYRDRLTREEGERRTAVEEIEARAREAIRAEAFAAGVTSVKAKAKKTAKK